MEYHVYWLLKSSCFEIFGDGKYGLFSSQKVDGKMVFTKYWKVLVLNFTEMGNTSLFWAKKLMERWYLLITEKFFFSTFRLWEIRFFQAKKLMERRYSLITEKFFLSTFQLWEIRFFRAEKLMERRYLLITEKFLFWTFRWWEMPLT